MKLINSSFKKDFDFSKPSFLKASNKEDQELGIDFWFCDIPVAYRKYRKNCRNAITIRYRRASGAKTEYLKILENSTKARLFIFDFSDKVIFTSFESIKQTLLKHQFEVFLNKDKITKLAVIKLEDIKHLEWEKGIINEKKST